METDERNENLTEHVNRLWQLKHRVAWVPTVTRSLLDLSV